MLGNMCMFLGLWMMIMNHFMGPHNNRLHNLAVYMVFFGAAFTFFVNVVPG
jgi:hypothetical protein